MHNNRSYNSTAAFISNAMNMDKIKDPGYFKSVNHAYNYLRKFGVNAAISLVEGQTKIDDRYKADIREIKTKKTTHHIKPGSEIMYGTSLEGLVYMCMKTRKYYFNL